MKKKLNFILLGLLLVSIAGAGYVAPVSELELKPMPEPALTFSGIPLSLTELDRSAPDFAHRVGTRFQLNTTKAQLDKARSIEDFLQEQCVDIVSYDSVCITVLSDELIVMDEAFGYSDTLTEAQLAILQGLQYSDNFRVTALYQEEHFQTGHVYNNHMTPHITVVPEQQAQYKDGEEAFISYVRASSMPFTSSIHTDALRPGKIHFTISQLGAVSEAKVTSSCGIPSVDEKMKEILLSTPNTWLPAKNAQGEQVAQELVYSYGLLGC